MRIPNVPALTKIALGLGVLLLLLGVVNQRVIVNRAAIYAPTGPFVSIDGCRYHYQSEGTGPAVVLLHGTGGSLADYDHRISDDLGKEFTVIAIDRPGHGHSERPAGDVGTPLAQARIVHQILHSLGVERAYLVGHSWSGALVLAYALEYPAETLGVGLVQGTVYRPSVLNGPFLGMLALPIIGPLLAQTIVPLAGRGQIGRSLERAFSPDPVPADYLARAEAMWTRPGQARAIALDAKGRDATIDSLSARYHELRLPIVLVVGGADRFIPPATQSSRFAREFPTAPVRTIPDAGHQIPQTRPEAVIAAVHQLAELASKPPKQ